MISHKFNKTLKSNKKLDKLDIIYENKIYVEKTTTKYNEYNQINLFDKLYELYISILKFIVNY